LEERARRRYEEEVERKNGSDFESIIENLKKRDQIDSQRKIAPLVPADDAIIVNTDGKSVEQVVGEIYQYVIGCGQMPGELDV
jgi:cytidylate kinase